jgi:hypothetical protein
MRDLDVLVSYAIDRYLGRLLEAEHAQRPSTPTARTLVAPESRVRAPNDKAPTFVAMNAIASGPATAS